MRNTQKATRRRVNMGLSQLIWEYRHRAYLYGASGLVVLTLAFIFSGGVRSL